MRVLFLIMSYQAYLIQLTNEKGRKYTIDIGKRDALRFRRKLVVRIQYPPVRINNYPLARMARRSVFTEFS
ncbi:hypothetical protein BH09BAC3_BH09BAC3_04160 [soil metagenome]